MKHGLSSARYGRLRQAALLVVAHRSTHGASAEVSALRRAFQAIDTTRDGTITTIEGSADMHDLEAWSNHQLAAAK